MNETGAKYRTCADILLRMKRDGILEGYKDGRKIGYSVIETRVMNADDVDNLFNNLVTICRANASDSMCKHVLNNIVQREGGNMPDETIQTNRDGSPKLQKRGKNKGNPIIRKNGGWGYLIRSTISVMGEYDLFKGTYK